MDFENVKSAGMNGVEDLTENDTVTVFYSAECCRVTFDLLKKIMLTKAHLEFFEITIVYPNSLDFQLSTKLGYDVAKYPGEKFVIISSDKGFRPVASFWQNLNADVSVCPDIQTSGHYIAGNEPEEEAVPAPDEAFAPIDEEDVKIISAILRKHKTKELVHKALMKEYGGHKATAFYHAVKHMINKKAAQTKEAVTEAVRRTAEQLSLIQPELRAEAPVPPAEIPALENVPAEADNTGAEPAASGTSGEAAASGPAKKAAGTAKRRRPHKAKQSSLSLLIPQYPEDFRKIEEIIGRYKTKLGISKALVREYESGKAEIIYSSIAPLIKDKKGKDTSSVKN